MKTWLINFLKKLIALIEGKAYYNGDDNDNPIIIDNDNELVDNEIDTTSADYWNNKWEQKPIIYYGRILKKNTNSIQSPLLQTPVDVRAFIFNNDALMKQTLDQYNLVRNNWDDTILEIQRHVCYGRYFGGGGKNFLTYVSDSEENETYEFWQFPFETIESHHGDCEDGAILIASLAINAGIPAYRVKVAAGDVSNKNYLDYYKLSYDNLVEGGHAYCIYLASDNAWRIIDWCWFSDYNVSVLEKPLAKDGGQHGMYLDTWFTFNNEYSWNQTKLDIDISRIHDAKTKEDITKHQI
jgi:hypothetical protein